MRSRMLTLAAAGIILSMAGLTMAQNTNTNRNTNSNRSNTNSNSNSNRMTNSNSNSMMNSNSNRMMNSNSNSMMNSNSNGMMNSNSNMDMSNSNRRMDGGRMMLTAAQMDMKFAMDAAYVNNAEIAAGQMALSKSQNADIRMFAQMMVDDHTKANAELAAAAGGMMMLPTGLDPMHRALADGMEKLSGMDFDMAYVIAKKAGHAAAHDMLKMYADKGDNKMLKSYAKKTEPVVKRHYERIKMIDMNMAAMMPGMMPRQE